MRKISQLVALCAFGVSMTAAAQQAAMETAAETSPVTVFDIDSEASSLRVLAYPDGPLKRFGHHHVISHHGITGSVVVAADPLESEIMLEIAVADLLVDDADQRALEGEDFEDEVPQKDKDGTRKNMLDERLLHGEAHPTIGFRSVAIEGTLEDATVVAVVTVKGVENDVRFPVSIELGDDAFVARGEVELLHGDLGLSQFTAMGGALSVRDLLVLKYEISGRPAE